MMAKATMASMAASRITNITKTCPERELVIYLENATRFKLAELRTSSTPIKIPIAFFLLKIAIIPKTNRIELIIKKS